MCTLQGPNYGSFKMIILFSFEEQNEIPRRIRKLRSNRFRFNIKLCKQQVYSLMAVSWSHSKLSVEGARVGAGGGGGRPSPLGVLRSNRAPPTLPAANPCKITALYCSRTSLSSTLANTTPSVISHTADKLTFLTITNLSCFSNFSYRT